MDERMAVPRVDEESTNPSIDFERGLPLAGPPFEAQLSTTAGEKNIGVSKQTEGETSAENDKELSTEILEGAANLRGWRDRSTPGLLPSPSSATSDSALVSSLPPSLASALVSGLSEHLASFPLFNPSLLPESRRAPPGEEHNLLCLMGPGGNCSKTPTPTELLGLLNEGTEWILTPTATILQSIGRTVDKMISGFVLRTARVLPNYRRNVIISYRDFRPFMLLEMLAQRNRFLHHLSSLFSSLQPIRSIYLRNLGMEIFELPDVLGIGEFMKAALGLRQYVDQVFEDQELTDFDEETQSASAEGSAETAPVPVADERAGDETGGGVDGRGELASTLEPDLDREKTAILCEGNRPNSPSRGPGAGRNASDAGCAENADANPSDDAPPHRRRLQVMPNDPFTWKQWPFSDSGPSRWGTEAPSAWEIWTGANMQKRLTVAVIDSGVDYRHPDLKNMIWHNEDEICNNGIDDDRNGLVDDCLGWDFIHGDNDPDDDNGHGTASAGIIAAEPNNHIGMAGICWGCEIMILKALNKDIKGTVSSFARAIDYALGKGVKISNNSYGGRGSGFHGLEQAVERARAAGMVFVAAAGNYNGNNDNDKDPVFPASYLLDNIISVAAITRSGSLANFSSYGKTQVDIAAPGAQIMSTSLSGTYRSVEGTSFAVPFVSGAVALVWSRFPYLPYREVIDRILRNAKYNPQLQGYIATSGVLDIRKALTNGAASLPPFDASSSPALLDPNTALSRCADLRCHPLATCVVTSTLQKSCQCPQGYHGNGYECRDIDECAFNPCGPASVCRNLPGSFECKCREGFRQVADTCVDIDECRESWGGRSPGQACPLQAVCQNFSGSFDCVCPHGSAWNAQSGYNAQCLTLNTPPTGPCVNNGGCGMNALCQASGAVLYYQRTCVCLNGYEKLNASLQAGFLGDGREVCIREGIIESEIRRYIAIMQSFATRETTNKSVEAVPTSETQNTGDASKGGGAGDLLTGAWLWPRSSPPPPASNGVAPCFFGFCLLGGFPDANNGP
ncbi:putative subtilisin-like protease [Neospora caninum Liverpool]|uniref:subtilisin n=1 Tax=Neospora caninum (strain Liverpool) TaxID=572307 RepID=F0VKI5_NEOCL|nr:putative subtilisin-like protease [Neospora caninum Liverpool]CBZ54586.1 putative subtilisin-like protease [Neospora caninum Liverpool]CEL69300.1 TPA: subtilisin-like protease, putative [Neospora caninum Liverpool]|eukprot:XP_003884616.1 putative subtilisin-like protease [Neospora caninum Liverpool]